MFKNFFKKRKKNESDTPPAGKTPKKNLFLEISKDFVFKSFFSLVKKLIALLPNQIHHFFVVRVDRRELRCWGQVQYKERMCVSKVFDDAIALAIAGLFQINLTSFFLKKYVVFSV